MKDYKRYFKCIKCERKYGTDNMKSKPSLCPVCVYLGREDAPFIKKSVIRAIVENEKKNNIEKNNKQFR